MTLATLENPENTHFEQITSLYNWWSLAGIDLRYDSAPRSLLTEVGKEPEAKLSQPALVDAKAATESKPSSKPESSLHINDNLDFPAQYADFLEWLSISENLVEAEWSRQYVLPAGVIEPEIMIITGMPDQEGLGRDSLFSEKCSKLLTNMLRAMGCDSKKIYLASLSLARSYDGRIDPQYNYVLKERMLHLIRLVRPEKIIFFGETPSQIFFDQNLLAARNKLQFINQFSYKTEAITTFHPRILVERPEFKREVWKDLQLLSRVPSL
ncbi:uracil-DNA glycosylase family protein [Parasphingorhabdus sp. JC815]|uniref:uracil-DNA glycosylase family protein n=1 Tax=Parasphingorhabdus sp. JC815 TaxID=3232140 RepID=UPI0034592433